MAEENHKQLYWDTREHEISTRLDSARGNEAVTITYWTDFERVWFFASFWRWIKPPRIGIGELRRDGAIWISPRIIIDYHSDRWSPAISHTPSILQYSPMLSVSFKWFCYLSSHITSSDFGMAYRRRNKPRTFSGSHGGSGQRRLTRLTFPECTNEDKIFWISLQERTNEGKLFWKHFQERTNEVKLFWIHFLERTNADHDSEPLFHWFELNVPLNIWPDWSATSTVRTFAKPYAGIGFEQIMGNSVYICKVIKNMATEILFMQQDLGLW
jgi:hypothetical protein